MGITTAFGWGSTAAEVIEGIDLHGKRAIVTGGASGIGIETARVLAGASAEVTIAVRNTEAGDRVAADIDGDVRVGRLDLADLESVDAFANAWSGPLHLLINNAGVMALQTRETVSGLEAQFATNHVGHFALTLGLYEALVAAEGARIVSLSSRAHMRSPVVFDDINFEDRAYDPWLAYGQSKTANVLFAVEATRRWQADGITADAVHPGAIDTNLSRHMDPGELEALRASGRFTYKTPEQGAATSVLVATSPALAGAGGRYLEDCNQAERIETDVAVDASGGIAAYALDAANAERLWDLSLSLLPA